MHPKNIEILAAAGTYRNARIALNMARQSAEQAREHAAEADARERLAIDEANAARDALLALTERTPFEGEGEPCERHPGHVKHLCLGFVGCDECERGMLADGSA